MALMRVQSAPGVQRDGTALAAQAYTDAQWCRWQRGLPRKMGGYKVTQAYLSAISRALFTQAQSGFRYVSSGNQNGVDQYTMDNFGVSSSVSNPTFPATTNPTTAGLVANANNTWQFDSQFDNATNQMLLFSFCGQNLLDPSNGANFPVYYQPIYSPGANASQLVGYGTGSDGHGGTQQALFPNGISGGLVSLAPYLCLYGNNGFFAWSSPGYPTDFVGTSLGSLYVGATEITNQKIIKGLPLRGGGGYSPNGLFWSIDSVVRATFIGVPNGTWQFDQITCQSSILSDRCVIENDGIFYWAGFDRFLMFNGVVQEIPNSMNINWFYDNINQQYASKAFAMKVPRYGEIWWCYPRGTNTECSHAVIYNFREKTWYDTVLPNFGRSSGLHADNSVGQIMGGTVGSTVSPLTLTSVATSSGGVAVYTGTISTGAGNALVGQYFTVAGFLTATNNGSFKCTASTATTITLNNPSAAAETDPATVTPFPFYRIWEHEQGVDEVSGTVPVSILSYFTTAPISSFDMNPPNDEGLSIQAMQPDFVQIGEMSVTALKRNNANTPEYTGTTATIFDNATVETGNLLDTVTNFKDTAKIIRLQFSSNTLGGNYQMGRVMLELNVDGNRDT